MRHYILFLIFLVVGCASCLPPEIKQYTVSGKVINYQNSLEGGQLIFYKNYLNGFKESIKELGVVILDSTGKFRLTYETDGIGEAIEVRSYNKDGHRWKDITGLPFAIDWNRDLNLSYNVFIVLEFNSSNPLLMGDTLYLNGLGFSQQYAGPLKNGTRDTITAAHYDFNNCIYWGTFLLNWPKKHDSTFYKPTGAPTYDLVKINYTNTP